MARGPAWTEYEDSVLQAARSVPVDYKRLTLVMPNRTDIACRQRAKILREESGEPVQTKMQRFARDGFCDAANANATSMLAAALARYQGNLAHG